MSTEAPNGYFKPTLFVATAAIAVVVIGAFGPWFTIRAGVFSNSQSGTEYGDGFLTIVLAAIAGIALFTIAGAGRAKLRTLWVLALTGIGIVAIASNGIIQSGEKTLEVMGRTITAEPGWGVLATGIAGLVLILVAGGLRNLVQK